MRVKADVNVDDKSVDEAVKKELEGLRKQVRSLEGKLKRCKEQVKSKQEENKSLKNRVEEAEKRLKLEGMSKEFKQFLEALTEYIEVKRRRDEEYENAGYWRWRA